MCEKVGTTFRTWKPGLRNRLGSELTKDAITLTNFFVLAYALEELDGSVIPLR